MGEKQWDIAFHADQRIIDYTNWLYLENFGNLKFRSATSTNAGVYIFANALHQVKYVGKAGIGRMVIEIYSAITRQKDKGATLVKALYTKTDSDALNLETELRRYFDPVNNLQ